MKADYVITESGGFQVPTANGTRLPVMVEEKGTYAFQQDFVRYHLAVLGAKPWLSGALYWTLREFRIPPPWAGGNPKPMPNGDLHQKGLIDYSGRPKPAFGDAQAAFRAQPPLG